MQNTAYGIYNNGQIIFDEPVQVTQGRVEVIFLDKREEPGIGDFFSTYGQWEDSRTADEIITDIRANRARISKDRAPL